MKRIIAGLTGASGSVYFLRLIDALTQSDVEIRAVASEQGEKVLRYECGVSLADQVGRWNQGKARVVLEDNANLFSPVASGSFRCDAMAIVPCSMSTAAHIANGIADTLLTRAADVMLKERRALVIVPRETPLSSVHLSNMLALSQMGAVILPAMPGFYNQPQTVDDMVNFVVGKTLDTLGVEHTCYQRWKGLIDEET